LAKKQEKEAVKAENAAKKARALATKSDQKIE